MNYLGKLDARTVEGRRLLNEVAWNKGLKPRILFDGVEQNEGTGLVCMADSINGTIVREKLRDGKYYMEDGVVATEELQGKVEIHLVPR